VALGGIVYPDALLAGLQYQGQTGVLTAAARIHLLTLVHIQAVIEDEHKHAYQQDSDHISQCMIEVIYFPYLGDLCDEHR